MTFTKKLFLKITLLLFSIWCIWVCGCLPPEENPACNPPQNLRVVHLGPEVTIQWDPVAGVDSFQVSIKPNIQPPGPFVTTNTSYTFTGLLPDTSYTAEVRSICDGVLSEPSSIQFRTTTIIIVDIITQVSSPAPENSIKQIFCGKTGTPANSVTWDDTKPTELVRVTLKNGNQTVSDFGVLKNFDSASGQSHFYILDKNIACAAGQSNWAVVSPPTGITSVNATTATFASGGITPYSFSLSTTALQPLSIGVLTVTYTKY